MTKTKHRVLSLLMAMVMVFTLLPATAFAAELDSGEVEATKTATYDEDTGKATITLSVKGKDVPGESVSKPVDVVLVVDNSGSMDDEPHMGKCDGGPNDWVKKKVGHFLVDWNVYRCSKCGQYIKFGAIDPNDNTPILGWTYNGCNAEITKMNAAKNAAYTLIEDIYAANEENRIAIVSFESGIYYDGSIGLTKGDSTDNVQAVLNAVDKMRADGGTNYTAALKQAQTYLVSSTTNDKYVIFVSDGAPGQQGNSHNKPEWNGTKQAEALRTSGAKIYTIGMNLEQGKDEQALEALASKPTAQYHKNLTKVQTMHDDLQMLIQKICAEITTDDKPAGTEATFTDLIDTEKFTLDRQDVKGLTIDPDAGEVIWKFDEITEEGASVSFTVTAKDDTYGNNIPTNKSATLKYTDSDGNSQEVQVANATVDIPSVTVTFHQSTETVTDAGTEYAVLRPYDSDSQPAASKAVTVEKGQPVTALAPADYYIYYTVYDKYELKGWGTKAATGGLTPFDFSKSVTENIDLYPILEEKTVESEQTINVYFNIFDGSWSDSVPAENSKQFVLSSTTADARLDIPGVVAPAGKKFVRWDDNVSANLSLNAAGSFSYNSLKDHVEFKDGVADIGFTAVFEDEAPVDPDAGKTLKIFWAIDTPAGAEWTTYGNGSPWTETIAWSDKGNTFVIPGLTVKDGYKLAGWSVSGKEANYWGAEAKTFGLTGLIVEDENGGSVAITANIVKDETPVDPDAGKTLKIYWAIDNPAGAEWTTYGNGNAWTETIAWSDKDNTFMIPGLTVKDGYKLAGWSVSGKDANYWDAGTKSFGLKGLIVEDENGGSVAITANIVKDETPVENTYTVTFDSNGGGSVASQPVKEGEKAVKPADPTRSGYTFKGWYLNGVKYDFDTPVTGNITLVAKWTEDNNGSGGGGTTHTYTLKYETNGGKKIDSESERSKWTKDYENLPVPTRSGYAFTGWYSDKKLTKLITDDVKVNTSVVTIYAGWRKSSVPAMLNGDDHFAYIQGYADGTVHPDNNITRAQVATIFFRLLDEDVRDDSLTTYNTFTDVSADYWANTAISTMSELGVIQGYSDGTFRPNAFITRAQFAAICARFDDTVKRGSSDFTDIDGHWAEAEIERAATLGWIQGYNDGTFRPNNNITRAQAMTMINRVLCRLPEDEDDLLRGMNTWTDCNPGDWCYLAVQEATNSHDFQHRGVYESWTDLNRDPDWSKYEN